MTSSASWMFGKDSYKGREIPSRWMGKTFLWISMLLLFFHTTGAALTPADFRAADSIKQGLHVKSSANAAHTGLGKAANLERSEIESGFCAGDLPRKHAKSYHAKVHPSISMKESNEGHELDQAAPTQGSASQSVRQDEANAEYKDPNNPSKASSVAKDQRDITASLRGIDFNNDEAYEMFTLEFRATLVKKMNEEGSNAQSWLDQLKAPVECSQRIRDDWGSIKSAAGRDYELANRGKIRATLLRWFDFFFRHWKWREERLNLQFLKIRIAGASQVSDHLRAALELDLVRRWDFILGDKELKLIERTANVGGDVEKLAAEERQLIKELSGNTLWHRRLAKIDELIRHFSSLQRIEEDSEVSMVITALKILHEKAIRRAGCTREETKLVISLGKVKDKDKIDRALNDDQKALLGTLVEDGKTENKQPMSGPPLSKENKVAITSSHIGKEEENGAIGAPSSMGPLKAPLEANIEKDAKRNVPSDELDYRNQLSSGNGDHVVNQAQSGSIDQHSLPEYVQPDNPISRRTVIKEEEFKPKENIKEVQTEKPTPGKGGEDEDGASVETLKNQSEETLPTLPSPGYSSPHPEAISSHSLASKTSIPSSSVEELAVTAKINDVIQKFQQDISPLVEYECSLSLEGSQNPLDTVKIPQKITTTPNMSLIPGLSFTQYSFLWVTSEKAVERLDNFHLERDWKIARQRLKDGLNFFLRLSKMLEKNKISPNTRASSRNGGQVLNQAKSRKSHQNVLPELVQPDSLRDMETEKFEKEKQDPRKTQREVQTVKFIPGKEGEDKNVASGDPLEFITEKTPKDTPLHEPSSTYLDRLSSPSSVPGISFPTLGLDETTVTTEIKEVIMKFKEDVSPLVNYEHSLSLEGSQSPLKTSKSYQQSSTTPAMSLIPGMSFTQYSFLWVTSDKAVERLDEFYLEKEWTGARKTLKEGLNFFLRLSKLVEENRISPNTRPSTGNGGHVCNQAKSEYTHQTLHPE